LEITTEIDFDVNCEECGSSLKVSSESLDTRKMTISLEIQPCQKCLNNAEDKGYESGQKEN